MRTLAGSGWLFPPEVTVPAVSEGLEVLVELLGVARSAVDFIRMAFPILIAVSTLAENVQFKTCSTMPAICCRTSSMVFV